MSEKKIAYEPHPVSPERKAELVAKGYKIIDAIYAPKGEAKPAKQADTGDERQVFRKPLERILAQPEHNDTVFFFQPGERGIKFIRLADQFQSLAKIKHHFLYTAGFSGA